MAGDWRIPRVERGIPALRRRMQGVRRRDMVRTTAACTAAQCTLEVLRTAAAVDIAEAKADGQLLSSVARQRMLKRGKSVER